MKFAFVLRGLFFIKVDRGRGIGGLIVGSMVIWSVKTLFYLLSFSDNL